MRMFASAAVALGLVVGGSAAAAPTAEASYIPKTRNNTVDFYYGYTDSTNKFCITNSQTNAPKKIGVRIYNSNGFLVGTMTQTGHLTKCANLASWGIRENATFKFKLFNDRGNQSIGYATR